MADVWRPGARGRCGKGGTFSVSSTPTSSGDRATTPNLFGHGSREGNTLCCERPHSLPPQHMHIWNVTPQVARHSVPQSVTLIQPDLNHAFFFSFSCPFLFAFVGSIREGHHARRNPRLRRNATPTRKGARRRSPTVRAAAAPATVAQSGRALREGRTRRRRARHRIAARRLAARAGFASRRALFSIKACGRNES
jgi:hypothetical protein